MSKEQRRLLSRLEYQQVVAAKRAAADAVVMGDRSEVTGKYEASEPDGSKLFGVKIDNSAPECQPVRSLKADTQLYLQGRTAPPKPKFGELEEAIVPKVSVPLEIPISPFSKDSDSLSAVDIDNRNSDENTVTPPTTHIGNTLGYMRGQIFDSPVEKTVKATYAYSYGTDVDLSRKSTVLGRFFVKFEFLEPVLICDLLAASVLLR